MTPIVTPKRWILPFDGHQKKITGKQHHQKIILHSSCHVQRVLLVASSITGRTSPDPSNTMPLPSTNNGSRSIYRCMVDVSKLTPAQRQHHAIILLKHYHELCNTNDPS